MVATIDEVLAANSTLSIRKYVRAVNGDQVGENLGLRETWNEFENHGTEFWGQMDELIAQLDGVIRSEEVHDV